MEMSPTSQRIWYTHQCYAKRLRVRRLRADFQEALELLAALRVPQLPERLDLDLADPLAGEAEPAADLLERVVRRLADAVPHPDDLLLARGEARQYAVD